MKELYIGRCYVCGKPIREDDLYGTMEDSDTLYCEACWNEYAERCDALIEQMKKEKAGQAAGCIFGNTPSENTCRFCGVSCGVRVPGANGVSSNELVPSGEAIGLSIMAYLDKNVKHDNGSVCGVRLEVARDWLREKLNPKQAQSEVELFERPETPIKDAVDVTSRLRYIDEDLKPIAEFIMDYASWNLHKDEWNHPTIEVPLFRVLDALAQRGKPYCGCGG